MNSKRLLTAPSFNRWMQANDAEFQQQEIKRRAQIADGVIRQVRQRLPIHGLQGACDVVWGMFRRSPGDAREIAQTTLEAIGWTRPPGRKS